jgi:O-succinylbenzoate synthase
MIESSLEIMAVSSLTGDVDDVEHRLIKALDWLSFDAATYADYITEGNALMRLFLCECCKCRPSSRQAH